MKTALFCNHFSALHLLGYLSQEKHLSMICLPAPSSVMYQEISMICHMQNIPLICYSEGASAVADKLREHAIELAVIFTFPHILPPQVTEAPAYGTWNLHGSPLPKYRGADPLFWQIRNGEKKAGLTLHRATTRADRGDIFSCTTTDISPVEIKGTLFDKVAQLASGLVSRLIDQLGGGIEPVLTKQDEAEASSQDRPQLDDLIVRWNDMDASAVMHLIHACNPDYSGALCWLRGTEVRLLEAESFHCSSPIQAKPGCIINAPDDPNLYIVCAKNSYVRINVLSTANAIASGIKFKMMFGLRSGEHFTESPNATPLAGGGTSPLSH